LQWGAVAQLGERRVRNAKVEGSIPFRSISPLSISADLKGALAPKDTHSYAAITDPAKVGQLMRAIAEYDGQRTTHAALRLAPYVFVRPGELRCAEWTEFDLEGAVWRIPAERMKMGETHIVPLSRQALAILQELKPLTGGGRYVFPAIGPQLRPLSENTLGAALRRIGYSVCRVSKQAPSRVATPDCHVPAAFCRSWRA
jgi:integrase